MNESSLCTKVLISIQVYVPKRGSLAKPRQKATKAEARARASVAQPADAPVPVGERLAEPSGRVDEHGAAHSEDDGNLASHTRASRRPQLAASEEFRRGVQHRDREAGVAGQRGEGAHSSIVTHRS